MARTGPLKRFQFSGSLRRDSMPAAIRSELPSVWVRKMTSPQAGIFIEGTAYHHYLEYSINPGANPEAIGQAVTLARSDAGAGFEGPRANVVIAFGAKLWSELAPGSVPEGLCSFEPAAGIDRTGVPSTQRDVFFWIHGPRTDDNLDRALEIHRRFRGLTRLGLDEKGFTYHDSRDLTGFIDGTANPKGQAAQSAALIPEGRPGAGGAFVLSQRWVHDLEAFRALPVPEQERVIGRTKADSVEFEGDAMPADAHVARTDVSVDGIAQKIYRRSAPFGSVEEHGLYFLAFSCELSRFDVLLRRMFGSSEDGIRDRLTSYSKPVTSSYWFAPSEEALRTLHRAPARGP